MIDSCQLDSLRRQVGGDVETMLAVAGTDVATVELLAATLLTSFQAAGAPVELPEVVLDAVEAPGDARSAGLLAAMAVLGRAPVADLARDRLERLHETGVHSPLEEWVGALEAVEAQVVKGDGFEVLLALLRRPRQRHPQLAMVVVDHEEHCGAAVDGFLTPPIRVGSIAAAVREATGRRSVAMPPGVGIGPAELAEALGAALARTAAAGLLVAVEFAAVVSVLSLALCGDVTAFSAIDVDAGHVLDLAVGDDEEFEDLVEEVAGHFLEAAGADPVVERAGDLVARSMLDWKWRSDGELGWWTCSDLDAFLFDYFCSSVAAIDVPLVDVPQCVAAFLCFLDDHDALEGEPLEELVSFVTEQAGSFVGAATDPAGWGIAKTLVTALWEAGVDPEDPFEIGAWLEDDGSDEAWAPQPTRVPPPSARRSASTKGHNARDKKKAARATRRRHR